MAQIINERDDASMDVRRKRLRRHEQIAHARFLTRSCYQRLPLLDHDRIRDLFAARLATVATEQSAKVLAWVIMPEHFHLLIIPSLPNHPVPHFLRSLKRPVAERVIHRWREMNAPIISKITDRSGVAHLWQAGGGYDRNIYSDAELHEKIMYIHQNPVRRGFVALPENWAWSSARWYAGDEQGPVPIYRQTL